MSSVVNLVKMTQLLIEGGESNKQIFIEKLKYE